LALAGFFLLQIPRLPFGMAAKKPFMQAFILLQVIMAYGLA
jgi:hypothetical protein